MGFFMRCNLLWKRTKFGVVCFENWVSSFLFLFLRSIVFKKRGEKVLPQSKWGSSKRKGVDDAGFDNMDLLHFPREGFHDTFARRLLHQRHTH